jgi:hypothetical protein
MFSLLFIYWSTKNFEDASLWLKAAEKINTVENVVMLTARYLFTFYVNFTMFGENIIRKRKETEF